MDEVLECRSLHAGVLRDGTLTVQRGRITAILGPVNAGVDTLRKILDGSLSDYEGDVFINGSKVQIGSVGRAQNLGLFSIGCEEILLPNMSIHENIGVLNGLNRKGLLLNKRWTRAQARYLMDRFGINVALDALPDELSEYQRHEVEILKAIHCGAAVLLFSGFFEEYTQKEKERFRARLRFLTDLGITVLILSEKPMLGWESYFDRIILMEQGVTGLTLQGRESAPALRKWACCRASQKAAAVNAFASPREIAVLDIGSGRSLLTFGKGEIVGILDAQRSFPRSADKIEAWLERQICVSLQGKRYTLQELKRRGTRVGIVCARQGESPVIEAWGVAENISYSAGLAYSGGSIINRRVCRFLARRTVESDEFFAPLREHLEDTTCAALNGSCRKRLELARVFAAKPDVVLLSHAFSQMDASENEELRTLIRASAQKRDCTFFVIESTDQEFTRLEADQVREFTCTSDGSLRID